MHSAESQQAALFAEPLQIDCPPQQICVSLGHKVFVSRVRKNFVSLGEKVKDKHFRSFVALPRKTIWRRDCESLSPPTARNGIGPRG